MLLVGLVLGLLVAGVAGAVLDLRLARTRSERNHHRRPCRSVDPRARAPDSRSGSALGALTVDAATLDNGLTSEDLGGMNHGVSGLVSQGYAEVTVQLTVNNATHRPVILQANQFRMLRQLGACPRVSPAAASATTPQAGPAAQSRQRPARG